MAKVDRLLAWMNLLVTPEYMCISQQSRLCEEIEKRYPVKLFRTRNSMSHTLICSKNTKILLDYLEILEQEEK